MSTDYSSINTTQVDSFIPEIWANEALTALRSQLNLAKTIRRDMDSEVASYGDTIHIPKTGSLSVNTKTTNENVTKQAPDDDEISVVLDQHKEVTFLVEDPARAMAKLDVRGLYIKDATIALAESIESAIAAEYSNAGSDETFAHSSDAEIQSSMLTIRKFFVDAKANPLAAKYLYAGSDLTNELLTHPQFTKANEYGSAKPIQEGVLGDMYGIQLFESQIIQPAGSPAISHNLAYTSDAIALVMRALPTDGNGQGVQQTVVSDPESGLSLRITSSYDANALGMQVTLDVLYGIKVIRDEFLLDVGFTA
jgi:hypothetical protein